MPRPRGLIWLALLLALGSSAYYSLRFLPFFAVRRIELIGLRYLDPRDVLDSLAIPTTRNLFDGHGPLEARARGIPGLSDARVERRLPGTLRIVLRERIPVAFLGESHGLRALDAVGNPLPYDPLVSGLSLPVVLAADSVLTRVLSLVRAMDSTLYVQVDAARLLGRAVVLESGARQLYVPVTVGPADFVALQAVRRDLTERDESFRGIDLRYDGWIVVRRGGA